MGSQSEDIVVYENCINRSAYCIAYGLTIEGTGGVLILVVVNRLRNFFLGILSIIMLNDGHKANISWICISEPARKSLWDFTIIGMILYMCWCASTGEYAKVISEWMIDPLCTVFLGMFCTDVFYSLNNFNI